MAAEQPTTLAGVLLTDVWRGPLLATSRTSERLGHIDFAMVVPPVRAFIYYMLCPFLCYPVAALHLWGYYRCLKTLVLPKPYKEERYASHVIYGVQKRVYDSRQKRLHETAVTDAQEIQRALQVADGERNHFVDDPSAPGVAYYVVEQRIMRAEAIFTGENWAWAFISDSCRYLSPVVLAYLFVPSCRRLKVDLKLWSQGRLRWRQLRHPVLNFFKSYRDYNDAITRINITKPPPKGKQPWTTNL
ncbi:uncharacterized protein TEOVI_000165400 [Trypanosoma equiperdum]|uniref:Uncharacterized protein n=4 Tax=Trypanozoon TaxID=39700 RepID=Q38AG3_TRYB2|nr:hypothetical protein, conserved [Trypanosoma brucei gambiense DAL972]XP_823035.1 hypothetical protein, conserved [Trypanosoma brucei brucei TREU927]RHW68915.1 hypothetical protein DPX39_100087400 [Trypanosoma brucei equiperdum]SCU70085.1 hypothetical protein, conserved [Trypanosoma equiperdum]EAN78207.1 hypothetical protein, conserved [Trypanosoma brucei brucei TREU927]CBH15889.1 hypothetical protein, conserved [Trypanosoma brucei gambiense DAL972]|eukprot:XP_011778153.1 hypothetical protein, conserved [Trypanosoma brucei gambiense DAL972]